MVMMSPQTATTKPAPAESRTSRTGSTWPSGAPICVGSALKLYCVLATQTGTWPKPSSSKRCSRRGDGGRDLHLGGAVDLPRDGAQLLRQRQRAG